MADKSDVSDRECNSFECVQWEVIFVLGCPPLKYKNKTTTLCCNDYLILTYDKVMAWYVDSIPIIINLDEVKS